MRTHLRNGWKRKPTGEWHAFGTARYSVNHWDLTEGKRSFNFKTNWNGGVAKDAGGEFYFMTAGGIETKPMTTNPSNHSIERIEKKPGYAAIKIQSGKVSAATQGKITVAWEIDPKTLPQFSFAITAYDNAAGRGEPLVKVQKVEPHTRSTELALPKDLDPSKLHWHLRCSDILGNETAAVPLQMSK